MTAARSAGRWLTICLLLGPIARAEFAIPPISGELSGDFTLLQAPDAPKVHWQLSAQPTGAGERDVTVTIEGSGARLRGSARIDAAGNATWKIDDGELDVAPWFPALVPYLPAAMSGITLSGKLRLTGEGAWRDGKLAGKVTATLRDGRLEDPALKLLLEGISLDVAIDDLAARTSPPTQTLAWGGGHYDVVAFGPGRVEFSLAADKVEIERGVFHAYGGELTVGKFGYAWAKPEFSVSAEVRGADLALLLPLLPPVVSEAHGRIDGTLSVTRDPAGIHIVAGRLSLPPGQSAELRLLPNPGVLSSNLPPAVKKYYPGLADLEAGRLPLKADLLEVTFTAKQDAEGRTAVVHVAGGPVDPRLRAPVDVVVNIRGPLEELVNLGTNSRLHFR